MAHPNMFPPAHIKGLIFDLDGTLADTMHLHLASWVESGKYFGVPITDQMIIDRAGTPTLQVVEDLNVHYGWSLPPVTFRARKDALYQDLKKAEGKIKARPHTLDIARHYHQTIPMSIGTGSIRANAEMALQDMGIRDWFSAVIAAEDVQYHKPHPDTFLRCAELMNIAPSECFVFEDGLMGVKAALAAGMTVIRVDTFQIFTPTT